jgi:hypothetical protein
MWQSFYLIVTRFDYKIKIKAFEPIVKVLFR